MSGYVNRKRRIVAKLNREKRNEVPKIRVLCSTNPKLASVTNMEPDSTETSGACGSRDDGEIRAPRVRKQVEPFMITVEEKRKRVLKPKTNADLSIVKSEGKPRQANTILKHFPLLGDSDNSEYSSSRAQSIHSDECTNDNFFHEEAGPSNSSGSLPFIGSEVTLLPLSGSKGSSADSPDFNLKISEIKSLNPPKKNFLHICKYCDEIYSNLKSLAVHQLEHLKLNVQKLNETRILPLHLRRVIQFTALSGPFPSTGFLRSYFRHKMFA